MIRTLNLKAALTQLPTRRTSDIENLLPHKWALI